MPDTSLLIAGYGVEATAPRRRWAIFVLIALCGCGQRHPRGPVEGNVWFHFEGIPAGNSRLEILAGAGPADLLPCKVLDWNSSGSLPPTKDIVALAPGTRIANVVASLPGSPVVQVVLVDAAGAARAWNLDFHSLPFHSSSGPPHDQYWEVKLEGSGSALDEGTKQRLPK